MTCMSNDDEMTPDEFDARAAAGKSVELSVSLKRPSELYRVTYVHKTGFSAWRHYQPEVHTVTASAVQQPASA